MDIIGKVKELGIPLDKFALIGSSSLAIRGIRESADIDIVCMPEIYDELAKKHPVNEKGAVEFDVFEIEKKVNFISVPPDLVISDADTFEGVRFVKLKYIIGIKKARNLEKDQRDLKLIEEYLRDHPEERL